MNRQMSTPHLFFDNSNPGHLLTKTFSKIGSIKQPKISTMAKKQTAKHTSKNAFERLSYEGLIFSVFNILFSNFSLGIAHYWGDVKMKTRTVWLLKDILRSLHRKWYCAKQRQMKISDLITLKVGTNDCVIQPSLCATLVEVDQEPTVLCLILIRQTISTVYLMSKNWNKKLLRGSVQSWSNRFSLFLWIPTLHVSRMLHNAW
jgi:small-conductance mechanosensitive channel